MNIIHCRISLIFLLLLFVLPNPLSSVQSSDCMALNMAGLRATESVDYQFQEIEAEQDYLPGEPEVRITQSFYINMLINLIAVILLIALVYYPRNRKLDQVFTFILFNIVIFIITYVLNQVQFSMGAAFGLFAVFTMLRYRTRTISMKDMTYLFVFIALGLINAVKLQFDVILALNGFVILATWVMDSNLLFRQESSKTIQYDQIEMIKPENHELLIRDLQKRTGLNITRFEINRVNFLRDTVRLTVYFREKPGGIYSRISGSRNRENSNTGNAVNK